MKAGWEIRPLGEVCTYQGGGQPPKSKFIDEPKEGYIRLLQIRDFSSDDKAVYVPVDSVTKRCTENDIMIGRYGASVGQIHRGKAGAYNVALMRTMPDPSHLDQDYFYYFLTSDEFQKPLLSKSSRGAQDGFNKDDLNPIPIPVPPLEEQRRIVAVLDEAFEGLNRARENTEANLANAGELFRIKLAAVFDPNTSGWPLRLLTEVCSDFGRGKSRHRPRNAPFLYGGRTPFIQTGDISQAEHYIETFEKTYSEAGLAQSKLWPKDTVCIAIVGATIGESGILSFDAAFPDSVIGMTTDRRQADPEFIEYLLQSFKQKLKEAGKGSARDNINLATFADRAFPIPELAVQTEIVSQLNYLKNELNALVSSFQTKAIDLEDLRQSLLQKAFAGELT